VATKWGLAVPPVEEIGFWLTENGSPRPNIAILLLAVKKEKLAPDAKTKEKKDDRIPGRPLKLSVSLQLIPVP